MARSPSAPRRAETARPTVAVRGAIAGAIVAFGAVVVAWWLWPSGKTRQDAASTKKVLIKEVKPAPSPKAEEPKRDLSKISDWELRHLKPEETNGLSAAQIAFWKMFHPWPPPDPNQPRQSKAEYKIFESHADNEIAAFLSIEPGDLIDGDVAFGPRFEKSFLKSLVKPIIVRETDSEHDKQLKRAVVQAKADLKAAYDRGEDICKIMEDSYQELRELGHYKEQLEKTALSSLKNADLKAADVEDVLTAVNKMLEERGIAPIEPNSVSRLAMKMQGLKERESNNE